MPAIDAHIHIARPPDAVFAYLADFSNDPHWRANVLAMRPLGNPQDLGGIWSRQVEVRRVPGRTVESHAAITTYAPPRELAVRRATGPIRPEARYRLTPQNGGTHLSFHLQIPLAGPSWLALPAVWLLLRLLVAPTLPQDLARLKQALETS
jgi:hypothetical protein